uniref:Uncharacterized protein LOC113784881 n=1 Tax=Cicer arietinum TaxID=3827 RepID=A0A3Q7XSV8_CICAR|nr:uncharacterized protein LOC113784881 [Cicer arietinum]
MKWNYNDWMNQKLKVGKRKIESDSCSNESSSDNEEPEIGLLVKKFKKFLKKKDNKFRKPSSSKTSDNKQITCYECGKTGHIKSECYKLQNKNKAAKSKGKEPVTKTKKAYIAWNDNDESSASSDEEEANMCLMANSDSESEKEVCLTSTKHSWYLDSGCSKHMTGDKSKFLSLTLKEGGFVKYGDNNRGKIIGIGDIGNESTTVIKNFVHSIYTLPTFYLFCFAIMARVKQTQPHTPSPSSSSTSETPSPPPTLTKRVPIPTHKILAKDKGKAPAPIQEKIKKRKEPPTEKLMADAMKEITQKRKKLEYPDS